MSSVSRFTMVAVIALAAMMLTTSAVTLADETDITYTVTDGWIEVHSGNTTILISTVLPAASVRVGTLANYTGDGFVIRSFLGYNGSDGLSPELVQFRAPTNRTAWTVVGPELQDSPSGTVFTVRLTSVLEMLDFGTPGTGPSFGGPPTVIPDWAEVTVRFQVSTKNFSATYPGVEQSPVYLVNGTTELKFDVRLAILKPLPFDSLAMDIGLMKMDDSLFIPTMTAGQYGFRGFQADEVSISDPYVNETVDSTPIVHTFEYRNRFKQMFEYFNESNVSDGFFSWASQCRMASSYGTSLVNVSAYYRTDGECLTVFLSAPIDNNTITIDHDPSVGVLGGVHIVPIAPSGGLVSTSLLSVVLGVVIGVAAVGAGGAGIYALATRTRDQDPADPVDLEKNRYYRGPR